LLNGFFCCAPDESVRELRARHPEADLRRHASISTAVAACLVLIACATPPPAPTELWPTKGWLKSTPEAQGIDSAALADAIETLRTKNVPIHSLLIERNGRIVVDAYFFPFADNEPHDVASITKSVTSTLVGIAAGEHAVIDVNEPVASLLPGWAVADPRKAQITLAQLLSMTSGLDCSAPDQGRSPLAQMETSPHWATYMLNRPISSDPGSRFEYCGGSMHIVSASLTRATGRSALDFGRETLFAPLGITDVVWPADPDGISHGFADLRLEPRDLARLGYLWLHDGRWDSVQVVPSAYLEAALAPHANVQPGVQYGYGMWLYPGHTPYDFEANGRGGQRIVVVPQLNTVVVITGGGMDANEVMSLIARAFVSDKALAANTLGEARLETAISLAAAAPVSGAAPALPDIARILAANSWFLPPNPLGVQSMTFNFPSPGQGSVHFGFADGTGEDHSIGLDGSPRLSRNTQSGLPVAVTGRWTVGSFELQYDEIARINAYRLVMTPALTGLSIHLTERSGLADVTMTATTVQSGQRIAVLSGNHG
jgi:CubicO group peptidase (beta-lactamase class C family)